MSKSQLKKTILITLNEFFLKKLLFNCDIIRAKVLAIAMSKNNHIISFACNRMCRNGKEPWSMHAEEALISKLLKINARKRYKYIKLVIIRHSTKKGWTMAKPCEECSHKIDRFGFDEIYYTNSDGDFEKYFKQSETIT